MDQNQSTRNITLLTLLTICFGLIVAILVFVKFTRVSMTETFTYLPYMWLSLLQLPPGAVPMFGGGPNPLAAAIKKHRKQDSDEVHHTLFIIKEKHTKMNKGIISIELFFRLNFYN